MTFKYLHHGLCCLLVLCLNACYSFKGISIPPDIGTFYVDPFQNTTATGPADIGDRFSESLRDIILSSSRLTYNETEPDIEFTGTVSGFNVTSVAPQEREGGSFGSALNRLQISIQVDYVNHKNEEDNWTQSFSFFEDFDSNTDLSSVQEELISNIFRQLTEDVFNRSFTNW